MVSKCDLLVGVLVLITGQVMFEFTPAESGGPGFLAAMFGMDTGHYAGSVLAALSGMVGLTLYRKVNKITIVVSVLSILLGVAFLAIMNIMTIMGMMAIIAQLTMLVGITGIAGSILLKNKRKDN